MSVFKGARVSRCQCLKVQRVTRVPRLKGQLRDRVFLRSHLRSSLTPEEGPSCFVMFSLPRAIKVYFLPQIKRLKKAVCNFPSHHKLI